MTQPADTPQPLRPMPRLGRGGRWGAHLDSPIPPTEPYKPKPRTRPAGGWAKTGTVGASAQLGDDEQPVTVPARPYDSRMDAEARRQLYALDEQPPAKPCPWWRRALDRLRRFR